METLTSPLAELPDPLALPSPRGRGEAGFDVQIQPPGSKSLTNRALLLAALARGRSVLTGALVDADDAHQMIGALKTLGARIGSSESGNLWVEGVDGTWKPEGAPVTVDLNLKNAGTATRFLAAAALLSPVPVVIDGNARMRERPIGELGSILSQLGARIEYQGEAWYPPMRVIPPARLPAGRTLDIPTTQSSQFISALLLIAPWLAPGLTIRLTGEITSASYVEMTVGLLQRLGARVQTAGDMRVVRVGPMDASDPGLRAFSYDVEPDASGATYFWGGAALVPGARCRVRGLDATSLQGDARFVELLARMGVGVATESGSITTTGPRELLPVIADMSDMPDAAMTLAVVACFAKGTTILRGLRTLRVKESDRILAMQTELSKLGVRVESPVAGDAGAMTVTPPGSGVDCSPTAPQVAFDTYDDHRIAMSLALVALRRPHVLINHPRCVAKTYANYWRDLASLFSR